MKPIANRISKLERLLIPRIDERELKAAEGVREARRLLLAARGMHWTDSRLAIPQVGKSGRRLTNGEKILLARHALQKERAEGQRNFDENNSQTSSTT